MQSTITLSEANRITKENVKAALAALPDTAKLKLSHEIEDFRCDNPIEDVASQQSRAERSYQVLGLDPDKISDYYKTLRTWWLGHGWEILREHPDEGDQWLAVERQSDGFYMGFQANELGEMYLESSSPCVWPNGTPAPEAAPARVGPEPPAAELADEPANQRIQPQPRPDIGPTAQERQLKPKPSHPRPHDDDEDLDDVNFLR